MQLHPYTVAELRWYDKQSNPLKMRQLSERKISDTEELRDWDQRGLSADAEGEEPTVLVILAAPNIPMIASAQVSSTEAPEASTHSCLWEGKSVRIGLAGLRFDHNLVLQNWVLRLQVPINLDKKAVNLYFDAHERVIREYTAFSMASLKLFAKSIQHCYQAAKRHLCIF